MSWLKDALAGAKPTFNQLPGSQPYIDRIVEAGNVGPGMVARGAKADMKAMRAGRIEDAPRLRSVLSAINARSAADYKIGERNMRQSLAFENQPVLEAAMTSELGDRINENAGLQFASAAADAYGQAESAYESGRRTRIGAELDAAQAAASAHRNSMFQDNRQGGIFSSVLREWLSPKTLAKPLGIPT